MKEEGKVYLKLLEIELNTVKTDLIDKILEELDDHVNSLNGLRIQWEGTEPNELELVTNYIDTIIENIERIKEEAELI